MCDQNEIAKDSIEKLEDIRKSKIIAYITGDRPSFLQTIIAEDVIRPLYEHILNLNDNEKNVIELFIYSRGGDVSVPWRIASMIRESCEKFNVLIPYKAHSAATLLSLGADEIVMGKKGELSPIDPSFVMQPKGEQISVEDVNSFISFIKERANINDQSALAQIVGTLVEKVNPTLLGNLNRMNSHIRLVARKLITSRQERIDEERINAITETLIEKIYSHGHSIARKEAKDMGLHVTFPDDETEKLLWEIYLKYESYLQLNEPLFPDIEIGQEEAKTIGPVPLAIIESQKKLHIFEQHVDLRKKRDIPTSPQININLNLQLPPQVLPEQLPQEAQRILQQLLSQIQAITAQLVQQEIARQSPVIGTEWKFQGGKWNEKK